MRLFIAALACLISVSVFGQECQNNLINIEVNTIDSSTVSWSLFVSNQLIESGNNGIALDLCLEDGCYNFMTITSPIGSGGTINIIDSSTNQIIYSEIFESGVNTSEYFQIGSSETCITGCLDENACNFNPDAIIDDISCEFPQEGYDCDGNCLGEDSDEDGICDEDEIIGCTDPIADNYNPDATDSFNELCEYLGCTDPIACNYYPIANIDDGSCEYSTCSGCTDINACNYDPLATIYDNSCEYLSCAGCTDPEACNFDINMIIEDESCFYIGESCDDDNLLTVDDTYQYDCTCLGFGCTNPAACNYEPNSIHLSELCDYESCLGCTYMNACNYDISSTIDDGSCVFIGDECDDGNELSINDVIQDNCECLGQIISGCTYQSACNYSPIAVVEDNSCLFIGDPCDDGDINTINDVIDENCFCGEIFITNLEESQTVNNTNFQRQLIKVLDELGREVNHTTNQILFHIYDDGSVEKKFIVE